MRFPLFLILFNLLLFSLSKKSVAENHNSIAESQEWLKLLHYKKGFFSFQSDTDNKQFFMAANGKDDPTAELEANITASLTQKAYSCKFPARFNFLRSKKLIPAATSREECPKLEEFRSLIDFKSLSIIFATNYPQSPPSVFGHTFIKANTLRNKEDPLLDLGINFSASVPPGEGTLSFGINGLFGGYTGLFATDYYAVKVREYGDMESRDLWEYEIELTDLQKSRFINHLWELMHQSQFDYFFLDENCSYQLLWPLAFATKKMNFLTRDSALYWLPLDTAKIIQKSLGSFKSTKFRSSLKAKLVTQIGQLSSSQESKLEELITTEKYRGTNDTKVLDTYLTYLEFQTNVIKNKKNSVKEQQKQLLFNVLKYRSKKKEKKINDVLPEDFLKRDPLRAHDSSQVTLTYGVQESKNFLSFEASLFTHDFLSFDNGFVRNSVFKFLTPEITYKDSKLFLSRFDFFKAGLITPYTFYDKSYSWEVSIQQSKDPFFLCHNCQSFELKSALGLSVGQGIWAPYLMVMAKIRYNTKEADTFIPLLSPKIGLMANFNTFKWNTFLEADRLSNEDYFTHIRLNSNLSYIFKSNMELRLGAEIFQRTNLSHQNFNSVYSKLRFSFF